MTEFDPAPDAGTLSHWRDTTDTFGRVYDVALGLTEPTSYPDVAAVADCSPNAAKKHLDRLAEMGIVRADREGRPARYQRNESYLEWQEASRIADGLAVEEIVDRVRRLERRRAEFEERFGTTDPASATVLDGEDHGAIHERMAAVSEWQAVDRDVRLYELARRLAQNDGHLLPA